MPGQHAIEVEGIVIEAMPNGRYRIELPNGHRFVGIVVRKASSELANLMMGHRVTIEMSPSDMSKGLIIRNQTVLENES